MKKNFKTNVLFVSSISNRNSKLNLGFLDLNHLKYFPLAFNMIS
jgi:hypothetical protein